MSEIKEVTLNKENMADIRCSKCLKNRSVDMSKYMAMDRSIRFKAKCSCGHSDTTEGTSSENRQIFSESTLI